MPIASLPLDMSRETKMFRAFVRLLQSDETLSNLGLTWQVSDGSEGDGLPFTQVQCPAIRLIPDLAAMKLKSVEDYDEGLLIAIDFGVAGTNADDRLNLWAAIRAALQSQNTITIGDLSDGSDSTAITVNDYLRQNGAAYGYFDAPPQLFPTPQPGAVMTNQYCRARYFLAAFVPG